MSLQELDLMRPTYERRIALPPEQVRALFEGQVDGGACGCHVRLASRHLDIAVAKENHKVYSPVLSLELQDDPHGTKVFGRYAPAPVLWTFFMFLYAAITFGAVSSLVGGAAQWMLKGSPWALWGLLIAAALAGGVYMAAQVGQQLSRTQMLCLKDFADTALEKAPAAPDMVKAQS